MHFAPQKRMTTELYMEEIRVKHQFWKDYAASEFFVVKNLTTRDLRNCFFDFWCSKPKHVQATQENGF